MTYFPQEASQKVQPFLIPASLAASIDAAMEAMRSPMFPRVTLTYATRELLAQGCDVLERELAAKAPIDWTVVDPPRGPRRREEQVRPGTQRVPDDTFSQLSPIALPVALIARLQGLQRRLTAATRKKVSFAKLVREALARGCVERERLRRDSEAFVRQHAALLALAGFPDASRITVVDSGVSTKWPQSRATSKRARPLKALTPRTKKAPKPTAEPSTASRSHARTPRRKAAPRPAAKGESGDDDGGDGPGRPHAPPPDAAGAQERTRLFARCA